MRTSRGAGEAAGMMIAAGLLVAGLAGCSSSSNNSDGPTQTTAAATQPSTTSAATTEATQPSSTVSGATSTGASGPTATGSASGSSAPTSGAPSSSAPSGPTSLPSKSSTPTGKPALPSSCNSLLDSETLTKALGKSLDGETKYIKGVEQPKIDRTGRTTCRYGVKGKSIPVEVGVNGYSNVDAATDRMKITIQAEVDAGAKKVPTKVVNLDGTILLGKNGSTILVQLQNRTVAITLAPDLVKDPQKALTQIAGTVMANLP